MAPKESIYHYAKSHQLQWNEDSTNTDTRYLRNKIRHTIVANMTADQRQQALHVIVQAQANNSAIEKELTGLLRKGLHKGQPVVNRRWFLLLPHIIANEVVYALLKKTQAKDIDEKTIERITVAIKTLPSGKVVQAGGVDVMLTKRSARFISRGNTGKKQV